MNNFNLMKLAGIQVQLAAVDRAFVALALTDTDGPAWATATIEPSLFTELSEQSRKEVARHVAGGYPGALWLRSSTFEQMADAISDTHRGSPLDLALSAMTMEAAEHFPAVVVELARREAAELAAITPQPDVAPTRKAGRL